MNYYQILKPEAEKVVGAIASKVKTLKEQIAKIQKRVADEKANLMALNRHKAKLHENAGQTLAGDIGSYEKYRTSITKASRRIETSEAMIKDGEREIAKEQTELKTAGMNLKITLSNFLIKSRPVAEERMNAMLLAYMREYDAFLNAFRQIYNDYGEYLIVSDERFCPGVLSVDDLDTIRRRVYQLDSSAEFGAPAEKQKVKQVFQINAGGKRYFCQTEEEKQIFADNHPGLKTESFNIELSAFTADEYLNDPENKKAFKVGGSDETPKSVAPAKPMDYDDSGPAAQLCPKKAGDGESEPETTEAESGTGPDVPLDLEETPPENENAPIGEPPEIIGDNGPESVELSEVAQLEPPSIG